MPETSEYLKKLQAQERYQGGRAQGESLGRTLMRAANPPIALVFALLRGAQVAQEHAPLEMQLIGSLFQNVLAGKIKVDQGLEFFATKIDWSSIVPAATGQALIMGAITFLGLEVVQRAAGVGYRWVTAPKEE